jgi:hypothetical protein
MEAPLYRNADGLMVNMYDCTPCPKCQDTHRYPFRRKDRPMQSDCHCDECGHVEPWTTLNGKPAQESI